MKNSFFKNNVLTENQCIYEPLKKNWQFMVDYLGTHETTLKVLIGSNSFMIDISLSLIIFYFFIEGNLNIIYTLFLFYILRGISFYFGQWPLPDPYYFVYPGFPSLYIPYDKTNDLYFSGHTGLVTNLLLTTLYFRFKFLRILLVVTWLSTVIMLNISGSHFLNDVIFGFLIAVFCSLLVFRHMYLLTYWLLRGYCFLLNRICCVVKREEDDESRQLMRSADESFELNIKEF